VPAFRPSHRAIDVGHREAVCAGALKPSAARLKVEITAVLSEDVQTAPVSAANGGVVVNLDAFTTLHHPQQIIGICSRWWVFVWDPLPRRMCRRCRRFPACDGLCRAGLTDESRGEPRRLRRVRPILQTTERVIVIAQFGQHVCYGPKCYRGPHAVVRL
jgi:hypothetical protein